MRVSKQEIRQQRLLKWLDGMSLEEKAKGLENGRFLICKKCKKGFFDKETPEERNLRKCNFLHDVHECVETDNYVVMQRNFVGIRRCALYSSPMTIEEAITNYFLTTNK